ncbi:MAG: hypothetical protein ACLQVL_28895 [Terriglobia bacterium]
MRADRRKLFCSPVFIAATAFALRMAILCSVWRSDLASVRAHMPYGDELGQVAASIASGQGFSSPLRLVHTGATAWFGPIYPYLVAGIFKRWGVFSAKSLFIAKTLNCGFAALTVFPIYAVAKRTFGGAVAIGASWIWVVLPTAWFIPVVEVWDSALSALGFMLVFQATLLLRDSRRFLSWMAYGALWAIVALISASHLLVLPLFLGWLVWERCQQSAPWMLHTAAAVSVFLLGMAPWTLRNYRVFGHFVPVRSNFGLELWLGNNPHNVRDVNSFSLHPLKNAAEAASYQRMGETGYMEVKQREALAYMRSYPFETLRSFLCRVETFWFDVSSRPASRPLGSLRLKGYFVLNALMILFSWFGAGVAYRRRNPAAGPYLFVLLIVPLVFYLTHTLVRYRFPMEPILTILAVYGLASALAWLLERLGIGAPPGNLLRNLSARSPAANA